MASTRSKLDEIVASFSTLEDPRSHINRRHPLPSILVIAVLAVLAGAAGPPPSPDGPSSRRIFSRASSTCPAASPARTSSAAS